MKIFRQCTKNTHDTRNSCHLRKLRKKSAVNTSISRGLGVAPGGDSLLLLLLLLLLLPLLLLRRLLLLLPLLLASTSTAPSPASTSPAATTPTATTATTPTTNLARELLLHLGLCMQLRLQLAPLLLLRLKLVFPALRLLFCNTFHGQAAAIPSTPHLQTPSSDNRWVVSVRQRCKV